MPVIGILGLGEAGGAIAADLRTAGADVRGYDPLPETNPDVQEPFLAAADADVVISLTTAAESMSAARSVLTALRPGQVYADANTAGAALKRELADVLAPTGVAFVDVALMAPVPGLGVRTPAVASGAGATAFAALLEPFGMPVTVLPGPPGVAAARKLLRSVAWKGVAGVVNEALAAARAAGEEEWMRGQLLALFAASDAEALTRMEQGSRRHAKRRALELADVAAMLRDLGVTPYVAEAARRQLEEF